MHIALGYNWFITAAGYHLERALVTLGHTVTYVGLPAPARPGYDHAIPITDIVTRLPNPPDLYLWIDPAGPYFPTGIEALPLPTACYLIDVHLSRWRTYAAQFFDAVFLAQKDYVAEFQSDVGHGQVYWLPLAAAPDVHRALDLPKRYDVGFVGNVTRSHHRTPRARRLRRIAAQFRTNDFFRHYSPDEVSQVYSQARIVVNISIAGDVTMRVFEGTACGALVLTDSMANGLADLFEPGRELVIYADDADLLDKIRHYLTHEPERTRIAAAGHRRTHADHTYVHRAQTLIETVTAPGFRRGAPMRAAGPKERRTARRRVYTHLQMLDALLDDLRAAHASPLERAWAILPCLLRRLWL
jgi:hypothetical protein